MFKISLQGYDIVIAHREHWFFGWTLDYSQCIYASHPFIEQRHADSNFDGVMLFTTTAADAYNQIQAIHENWIDWPVGLMDPFLPDTTEESDVSTRHDIKEPSLYKVLLHNDDYTTMEFVVHVLMEVFHKPFEDATRIMLNVHEKGVGVCGLYTFEVAETKVETVVRMARESGHPLRCTMEKV